MKTRNLFSLLIILLVVRVNAQEWMRNLKNPNPNFYEIQKAFNDYWKDKTQEKGKGYNQFKRWEWFWEQRVGQSGKFPSNDVLWRAQEEYNANHSNNKLSSVISGTTANWTFKGPYTSVGGYRGIGRVNCIAFHPTIANTFWVGTPAGGLWKTTDAGTTWTTNTDNLPVLGVSDIAIDPSNPNIMYIATGDGDAALSLQNGMGDTKSIGILKSTNGGLTWSAVLTASVTQNVLIRRLIIDPTNPQILLAATSLGIWRTNDGGTTWSAVTSTSLWFIDLEFKPTDPNYVYATTFDPFGGTANIYTSTNKGLSWTQVTSFTNYNRINIAVSANAPSLVDALCSNASGTNANGLGGLWFSNNNGASFSQYFTANCTNNLLHGCAPASFSCGGQGSYDLAYAINPTDANEIWIGGVNTWRSINGGANWSINNYWSAGPTACGTSPSVPIVHADKHFIAYHPLNNAYVYECNDGGLYVTNNDGANWYDLTNGMGISQIYRIGTSATVANDVICGLQDNGTKEVQTSSWSERTGGDGMECIIDYTNQQVQYATYTNGQISKTSNGWSTQSIIVQNNGTGVNAPGAWVTPYIMHPTNNNILLVGKAQVYQSTNGGSTWAQLGTIPGITSNILSMAYAPSNPNVIYVATDSQFFKTINGGATWTLMGTSVSRITYITVDPLNPNRVWQTNSGYAAGDKVWYSPNGGTTWTNFSGTLPNIPINCIVYQNGSSDGLYIGTDLGVFYRNSTMSDWIPYNTGLPNVIVNELEISYNNNKLWAATFGRGLWNSDLYCANPSQPGTISGLNNMCANNGVTTYSIAPVSGATSYIWSLPGGWSGASTTNIINGTPGNTGVISVIASNSCGVSASQTLAVTVNSLPSVSIIGNNSICSGSTLTLTASGANTYTWNTGPTTPAIAISPTINTTYTVTGANGFGCTNTSVKSIIVNPLPTINITSAAAICIGQTATLVATGANTYTWNTGPTTPAIVVSPTISTNYTVTGTDGAGCINSGVKNVSVNPLPIINAASTSSLLCVGQTSTLTATGANTYTWSTSAIANAIVISPTVTTSYTVNGTDINGCNNFTIVTQNVSGCVGLKEQVSLENGINIYPNPFNDNIILQARIENCDNCIVEIYNALGALIHKSTLTKERTEINLSQHSSGVYFIKVSDNKHSLTKKIVKE